MSLTPFSCDGGYLMLPDRGALLVSREHGGNLVVNPPRTVWERSELTPAELTQFGFLVSAADRAMLDVRPQLGRGCINCWEAGNWALNDEAEPKGRKDARGIARCTCICSGEARRGRIRRGARASRHGFRRSRRRIHGPRIVNGQSPHVCAECRPS